MEFGNQKIPFNAMNVKLRKKAGSDYTTLKTYEKENEDGTFETMPVLTAEDVKLTTPLLNALLGLPKYQKMIGDLKKLLGNTPKGIVNIVTGMNTTLTELTQGVLLSAIPPNTKKVFKGAGEGYGIDASHWGDQAGANLRKYLVGGDSRLDENGLPEMLDSVLPVITPSAEEMLTGTGVVAPKDFKLNFRGMTDEQLAEKLIQSQTNINSGEIAAKRTQIIERLNKARTETRDRLNDHLDLFFRRRGADASNLFGLPDKAPQGNNAEEELERGSRANPNEIQLDNDGLPVPTNNPFKDLQVKIALISQLNKRKQYLEGQVETNAKLTREQRRQFDKAIAAADVKIDFIKGSIDREQHPFAGRDSDKSGFLYYKPFKGTSLQKDMQLIKDITDPETSRKTLEDISKSLNQNGQNLIQKDLNNNLQKAFIRAIDNSIAACQRDFKQMGLEELMKDPLNALAAFVGFGKTDHKKRYENITDNIQEYVLLCADIAEVMEDVQNQKAAMVIYNVDQTNLVLPPPPGTRGPSIIRSNSSIRHYTTAMDEKNELVRAERTIVFVTEQELLFEGWSPNDVPKVHIDEVVDSDEAKQLIEYQKREFYKSAQRNGYEFIAGRLDLTRRDFEKIQPLIIGKTTQGALSILSAAFNRELKNLQEIDRDPKYQDLPKEQRPKINGLEFVNLVRNTANQSVADNGAGLTVKDPENMDFRTYQFVEDSAWGQQVEEWLLKIREIHRYWKIREEYAKDLHKLDLDFAKKKDPATIEKKEAVLKKIRAIETALEGYFGDFGSFHMLEGEPGVGKSIFVERFANKLGFQYAELSVGNEGGTAGSTERATKELIDSLANLHDTVILWDEIDKNLPPVGDKRHYWETRRLSMLQKAFADPKYKKKLSDNHVIVIGTCNNPEILEPAMLDRFTRHEVPPPTEPKHYAGFLRSAVDIMKESASTPRVPGEPQDREEAWEIAKKMFNTLDYDALGEAFAGSNINFRNIQNWLKSAMGAACAWEGTHLYKYRYWACNPVQEGGKMVATNPEAAAEFKLHYTTEEYEEVDGKLYLLVPPKISGFPWKRELLNEAAQLTKGPPGKLNVNAQVMTDGVAIVRARESAAANAEAGPPTGPMPATINEPMPEQTKQQGPKENQMEFDLFKKQPARDPVKDNVLSRLPTQQNPQVPLQPVQMPSESVDLQKDKPQEKKKKSEPPKTSTDHYLDALIKNGLLNQ